MDILTIVQISFYSVFTLVLIGVGVLVIMNLYFLVSIARTIRKILMDIDQASQDIKNQIIGKIDDVQRSIKNLSFISTLLGGMLRKYHKHVKDLHKEATDNE
jgi:uncharacterized membrane protein YgaE (UPF0421/DUF939 family)